MIPGLRYRDAITMIDWLCEAFGFEKQAVHTGPEGVVLHAQLTFGNGMIMIGSVGNGSTSSQFMKQPDEIGGAETQTPYLVVADIDAVYATARAAGAKIVIDLEAKDYGGKAFSCTDPEGYLWHLGSFDPWDPPHGQSHLKTRVPEKSCHNLAKARGSLR
ncbi:MAG: VOC family protein [Terracidiphilus sp.]